MKDNLRFLIVEDDESFRETVRSVLGVYNEMDAVADLKAAREILKTNTYDVIILDKTLKDGSGTDLIPEIKAETPNTVIVMLTADDNYNQIQKCLAAGAADYIVKSKSLIADLLIRVPKAVSQSAIERHLDHLEKQIKESLKYEIMGSPEYLRELRSTIKTLKWSRTPVLITGESGTGKELVAQRIHATEEGCNRPLVVVNCGAISENLIESELFGHAKGSFTSAVNEKIGKIELANGGDLFLDEIGELPLSMQPALLRVLQDGCFTRVGSNKTIHSSFRVIAATNRDIEKEVAEGRFREDLYYRLQGVRINAPPLRKCFDHISDIAHFFLVKFGGFKLKIDPKTLEELKNHEWRGNFRELGNSIERAMMVAKDRGSPIIESADFSIVPLPKRRLNKFEVTLPTTRSDISYDALVKLTEEIKREFFITALKLCNGRAADVATLLNVSRATAFRQLGQLGLVRRSRSEIEEERTNA